VVIKETREKNREKERRHFTSNQRCRGKETEGEVEVEEREFVSNQPGSKI